MATNPSSEPPSQDEGRYPRPPVTLDEAETVWRDLASAAMDPAVKPEVVRLAVIVGLTRATGARYGDLLRCTIDSFDLGAETARATEGQVVVQHGKHRTVRQHRLDPSEVVLMQRWLEVRAGLCAELEGSEPRALLLTVHHTHDNGVTVASGLPITKQGLVLSWRRHVQRTNARWAGMRPPLPTRFEQVRRAWHGGDPDADRAPAAVRAQRAADGGVSAGGRGVKGSERSRRYWETVVRPVLVEQWPDLRYAAARLGSGSEVLGLDDATSTDHDWGNRLTLLVDADQVEEIDDVLEATLPAEHDGMPARFATTWSPQVRHRVEVSTVAGFARSRLGIDASRDIQVEDWLALTGQSVLEVVGGDVFEDTAGELTAARARLAWLPHDVWLHVLACEWAEIGQELPFVGRTGDRHDDLGSRVITARIVERAMRLGFWLDRRWPPYAKWLGTMHAGLPRASRSAPALARALRAETWSERESALADALVVLHALQRESGLPTAPDAVVPFFDRGFVGLGAVPEALLDAVTDPAVAAWSAGARRGSVGQWVTSVAVLMDPDARVRASGAVRPSAEGTAQGPD